jgi:protein phosphatase
LTQQLAPGAYLFAVAHGFGSVEGEPIAPSVLRRLRDDVARRARGGRLRRAQNSARGLTPNLLGAFTRVNSEVHARTASHEDYVTAGCSLTGVLLIGDRAYLAHVGSTAAYLSRDGYVVSLTKNDTFEESGVPVLTRALGSAPNVEVAVSSFSLNQGDALVLAGRRLREADEHRRLAQTLAYCAPGGGTAEQLLVVRYSPGEDAEVPAAAESQTAHTVVTGVLATLLFYVLLCIR